MRTRVKLEFVHPLVNLPGKCDRIVMWKAVSNGSIELNFAEDNVIVNNITFKAVYDSTHPTNPLGLIDDKTDL